MFIRNNLTVLNLNNVRLVNLNLVFRSQPNYTSTLTSLRPTSPTLPSEGCHQKPTIFWALWLSTSLAIPISQWMTSRPKHQVRFTHLYFFPAFLSSFPMFVMYLIHECVFSGPWDDENVNLSADPLLTRGESPMIIIIAVSTAGSILLILCVILVVCFLVRRRRKKCVGEGTDSLLFVYTWCFFIYT